MTAKRFWSMIALVALAASTGCRSWCEHHYPCPPPCTPCCPPAASAYPAVPAAPPPSNWGAPKTCTCTCPP